MMKFQAEHFETQGPDRMLTLHEDRWPLTCGAIGCRDAVLVGRRGNSAYHRTCREQLEAVKTSLVDSLIHKIRTGRWTATKRTRADATRRDGAARLALAPGLPAPVYMWHDADAAAKAAAAAACSFSSSSSDTQPLGAAVTGEAAAEVIDSQESLAEAEPLPECMAGDGGESS